MNSRTLLKVSLAGIVIVETVSFIFSALAGVGLFLIWYAGSVLSAVFFLYRTSHFRRWTKIAAMIWLNTWYIGPSVFMLIVLIPVLTAPNQLMRFPTIERMIYLWIIKSFIFYFAVLVSIIRLKTDDVDAE